jgi:hypothetical protein
MSGVPFATVKSAINCRIGRGCIPVAYLKIAQLSCFETLFEQFRGDFRDASFTCEADLSSSPIRHLSQAIGAARRGDFNYQMREVLALDKHCQTIL